MIEDLQKSLEKDVDGLCEDFKERAFLEIKKFLFVYDSEYENRPISQKLMKDLIGKSFDASGVRQELEAVIVGLRYSRRRYNEIRCRFYEAIEQIANLKQEVDRLKGGEFVISLGTFNSTIQSSLDVFVDESAEKMPPQGFQG